MSTSFPSHGSSRSQSPRSRAVSLRALLDEAVFVGAEDIVVSRCVNRADQCQPGDVFIPQLSAAKDEHDNVEIALKRGAVAVVSERILPVSVPQCLVENTQVVYSQVCQSLAGCPSHRMLTIGILGTSGKTTTALFVSAMLKRLGGAVAYYTSIGASDSTFCDRSATKAPGARKLSKWMEQADRAGSPAAVIELSPAMLHNHVAAGVEFDLLIVTGMRPSQFRGSPSARRLSDMIHQATQCLKPHGLVLYNADDAQASLWAEKCETPTVSYGLDAAQHVRGKRLSRFGGEQQLLAIAGNTIMPMTLKMPGDHIARAALAAVAASWMFDFSIPDAVAGAESLETIPGRMQRVPTSVDIPVYIDACESPDRLAVALHALQQHQFGPSTVVFDLSNFIDSAWRQRLGEVLDKGASRVVLSASDHAPQAAQTIAMDVLGGFRSPGQVQVIPDRNEAIRWAINNTEQGCILLAGCGANSWVDRQGEETTDEKVAKHALAKKNQVTVAPILSVFPPSTPSAPYVK